MHRLLAAIHPSAPSDFTGFQECHKRCGTLPGMHMQLFLHTSVQKVQV